MKFRKIWEISKQQPRDEKITQEWRKADFFLNSVSLKRRMISQTGLLLRTGGTLEVIYCKPLSLKSGRWGLGREGVCLREQEVPADLGQKPRLPSHTHAPAQIILAWNSQHGSLLPTSLPLHFQEPYVQISKLFWIQKKKRPTLS